MPPVQLRARRQSPPRPVPGRPSASSPRCSTPCSGRSCSLLRQIHPAVLAVPRLSVPPARAGQRPPARPDTFDRLEPLGPQRQLLEVVERLERDHRCPPGRRPGPAPSRAAGRPAPCCGPAPGRAGRCRAPGPTRRPRCRRRPPLPTPCSTRASGRAPGPTTDTPPWFSNPVSRGSGLARPPCAARPAAGWPPAPPRPAAPVPFTVVTSSRPTPLLGPARRVGEGPADELEPGAHRQDHRALGHPAGQGALLERGWWPPAPGGRPRPRRWCRGPRRAAAGRRAPGRARRRCPARRPAGPGSPRSRRRRRCRAGRGRPRQTVSRAGRPAHSARRRSAKAV